MPKNQSQIRNAKVDYSILVGSLVLCIIDPSFNATGVRTQEERPAKGWGLQCAFSIPFMCFPVKYIHCKYKMQCCLQNYKRDGSKTCSSLMASQTWNAFRACHIVQLTKLYLHYLKSEMSSCFEQQLRSICFETLLSFIYSCECDTHT